MSTITKLIVDVTAKGMEKLKGDSQQFHDNMVKGAAATKKAVLAASAPAKSVSAARQESQDYGVSRSLRPGGTGASARDFAQEAQGLGGLVRLYATYAANIFAVGAAFRALTNAMDTTNMVRGLDQLGAASGTALGSLSKRLVVATDGAISLREAMESVAKASSSGMSSENILRMGKVAKQASQALGVDMADAVNRITRGITKLEPELLDEIGIFTRVDSAVKEYAKSTGKAAGALTDFERRMAFANAVLEEGERKFSAIEIDTNPYTKLSAAIKNAAQEGLELANTVLAPIVNLLSQSPTALMAILGSLGLMLVRQALPAIGEFKAGLANAADRATKISIQRAQDAADAKTKIERLALQELTDNADARVDAIDRAAKRIEAIETDSVRKRTKLYQILKDDTYDLAKLDDNTIKKLEATTSTYESKGGDPTIVKAEREAIDRLREGAAAEREVREAMQKTAIARRESEKGVGTYAQTLRIAERAQVNATKAQIVSTAAYNGGLLGMRDSFTLMREDIAKSNLQLSAFSKATLTARGGLAILGGAVTTLGSVLSGAFMWIGLITGALAIFDSIFSKASKVISGFSTGVDSLEQSTANLQRTLDTINSNNPFSVKSLEAQGTAMMEFSSSVDGLGKSADKALAALKDSGWDRFKNTIKSIWGGDVQSTFSDSLAKSISTAVEDLENSPIQTKLQQTLGSILNIKDVTNVKELEKALSKLEPSSAIVKEISKAIKQAGIEASNTASKAREFSDAFKKSEESFKNFTKQFDNKDSLVQYAVDGMKALGELSATISGPLSGSLDNITTLLNSLDENPIFGVEKSQELAQYASEMGSINKTIVEQTNKVQELTKAREEQERALKALTERSAAANNWASQGQRAGEVRRSGNVINDSQGLAGVQKKALEEQRAVLDSTNRALVRAQDNIAMASARGNMIAEKVSQEIPNGIIRGKELLITALDASLAKGANAFKSSIISSFGNLPGFAKAEANVQIGEIGIEKKLLDVQFQMLREQVAIKLATTKSALLAERADLEKSAGTASAQGRGDIQQKLATNIANTDAVTNAMASVKAGKSYKDALVGIEKLDQNSRELLTGYAISVAGITAKLQQLGQQQLSIRFQAEVKEIQAKATQAQQVLDTEAKNLQLSKDQLALRKNLTAEERLANETSISRSTILNTASKEQVAAAFAYAEISTKIAAYESLKSKKADDALALEAAKVEQARLYESIVQAGVKRQVALATEDEASKKRGLELGLKRETQLASIARIEEGITQNSKEAGLSIEEQRLSVLQEILGTDSRAYTTLQTSLDAQRQQLDVERQIADVKAQSGDRLRSLQSEALNAEADTTRAAQITAEIEQERNRAALQISNIQAVSAARTEATAAIQAQNDLLAQQNETLATTESLANSLASAFGSVGEGLGGAIVGLQNFIAAQEQSALKQATLTAAIEKANKVGPSKEGIQLQKQLDKEVQKSKQKELEGIADVIGSTKKMFKEKTAAYKILNATEKALHIAKLAMWAKEMMAETTSTASNIANNATKSAANGLTAITEALKAPWPIGFVAGAAMAAIVASLLGGSSSVSIPSGMSAEDVQKVQGTGQDWVNGKLVDNGGGVLGDSTAKSEDIANSLQIIEDNTTSQILFDSKAVDYLRAIRTNTEGLAAALFKAQGISGGPSGFGTLEKSSPGFLGLFSSSTSIIDSGIKAVGKLGEILADPTKYFKQYETVQKTKSGFLGIGGGTKINVNTKPLEVEITEYITGIFQNAQKAIVDLGTVFGMNTKAAVDQLVNSLSVDFQVSAKDLSGDELIEAIMAETGVTMNQLAAQVYPFLEQFQKVGEGMLTTLTRVNTEIQVVNGMFAQMGIGFASTLASGLQLVEDASTDATSALVADAKARYDAAKLAKETAQEGDTYIERIGGTGEGGDIEIVRPLVATPAEIEEYNAASAAYTESLKAENNAKYASIIASIAAYDALVESEGGLDKFTERANFFIQNFVPSSTKFKAALSTVDTGMAALGLSSTTTRAEFYTLVAGLDLSTEAGRAMYSSLMDIAPAFDEIQDAVDGLAASVSISASSLSSTMTSAFMDGVNGSEIGKKIASIIERGMYQAMISKVTDSISQMIYDQILSPMLVGITKTGTVTAFAATATVEMVVEQASAMMGRLADVFNDPAFQKAMREFSKSMSSIDFGGFSVPSAYQYSQPGPSLADQVKGAKDAAFKAMDDAFNALKKSVDTEKKLIQKQIKLAENQVKKLDDLINVLDSNIKELRGSVTETAAMQAAQGNQFIKQALQQAIATGILPDSEELSEAIGAVRAEIDLGNYDSKFAEDRTKLILAGQLDQLKALGLDQKTDAELQLEALNTQIEELDKLVEAYQLQIDAIKGVDTSVKSVAAAITSLEAAMAGALRVNSMASSGGYSSGGGAVFGPGGSTPSKNTGNLTGTTRSTPGSNGDFYEAGKSFSSEVRTSIDGSYLPVYTAVIGGEEYTARGGGWFNPTEYLQKNPDVSAHIGKYGYTNTSASTDEEFAQWHFQTYGIAEGRKYAKGGIFDNSIVTAPTLFNASLMGEAGPEAIMPLGKMPDGSLGVRGAGADNAELIAEIKNLKAELTHMKQYVAKTSTSTEESRKLLDEVVRGGSAITVESGIASY